MNFSQAVRGGFTNFGKQHAIESAAETELGRSLTKEEKVSLSTRFSIDLLYANVQKVNVT